MPWSKTPCDLTARVGNQFGERRTARERSSRVEPSVLKKVWERHHGTSWPDGLWACHHCDEPRCSNPEHIFPGTQSDNHKDAFKKGRLTTVFLSGESHKNARLTYDEVTEIRVRWYRGESQRSLGQEFGVNQSTISRIVNWQRWEGGTLALERC